MTAALVVALAVAMGGCGRIGYDSVQPDASCGTFTTPPASSYTDDFADNVLAPDWGVGTPCMQQVGGELVAQPPANATGYCVANSAVRYHLMCSSVTVHVAQATAAIHGAQTGIYFTDPADQSATLLLDSGGFLLAASTSGAVASLGAYDPIADAWWRVSADPATLAFETSADGLTWNVRGRIDTVFPIDNVIVGLAAGAYLPVADPGVARFHCYNKPPPCQ